VVIAGTRGQGPREREPDLDVVVSNETNLRFVRGDERTRTADPLLAKQVLYRLSYVPAFACGNTKLRPCTPLPQLITLLQPIDGAEMRNEGTSVSTGQSVGDVRTMVASFKRHVRAGNVSERTIQTRLEACGFVGVFEPDRPCRPMNTVAARRCSSQAAGMSLQNRWAGESPPAGSIPVSLRHRKRI
jgi:hypothetical protein